MFESVQWKVFHVVSDKNVKNLEINEKLVLKIVWFCLKDIGREY